MTMEALQEAIKRLIIERNNTNYRDTEELDRINKKLNKLYDIKYLMIEQSL